MPLLPGSQVVLGSAGTFATLRVKCLDGELHDVECSKQPLGSGCICGAVPPTAISSEPNIYRVGADKIGITTAPVPETRTVGMLPALAAPYGTEPESILQEAHRLTHGPRRADYGHPLDDYNRTAALVSALLAHKLKEPLTADEMALAMVCVKLSRQVHFKKRDNTVDGAGYFWVAQECIDETERRAKK